MDLKIVNFEPHYAIHFYDLNIEWLKTFFYVEPYDEAVLSNPKVYILDKGGFIFFAVKDDAVVGTAALMPTTDAGIFELTKIPVIRPESVYFTFTSSASVLGTKSEKFIINLQIAQKYGLKVSDSMLKKAWKF